MVQLFKYAVIGFCNTILDFLIYAGLTRGWDFWKANYLLANAVAFVLVATWSFFWNKYWTFQDRSKKHTAQYIKFLTVNIVALGISQTILYTGVDIFSAPDLLVKVFAIPFVVLWSFSTHRLWTFV